MEVVEERQKRLDAGLGEFFNARDVYPDVRPCLEQLKAAGFTVGDAGNQTARAGRFLHELNLPGDWIITSDDLGAEKSGVAFFEKLIEQKSLTPEETAYVGDRFENDVMPAQQAGLAGVLIRRGPWGFVNEAHPESDKADLRITSLTELQGALGARD